MRTHSETVADFLEFACWDEHIHGKADHRVHDHAAMRLLARNPAIAGENIYTAVVCGELDTVNRMVRENPAAAIKPGGKRDWTPLQYLCYTRFSNPASIANAVAMGRLLLAHGANPNDSYPAGDVPYTALVGAAGEGEQDSPRQPQGKALFQLLLDAGAEPFDAQVLYNTHFSGDVLWWLELIHVDTAASRPVAWADPNWAMLDMGAYGPGAWFLLNLAVKKNDAVLAEWLLAHGAGPNASASTHPKFRPVRTHYQEAMKRGQAPLAELLLRYGATPAPYIATDEDRFEAACLRLNRAEAQAILEVHPDYLASHHPLFAAARLDRPDAIGFLLDLGMSIEVQGPTGQRPLHEAAIHGSLRAARFLIERGAEVDPVDKVYRGTPMGFASYHDSEPMLDLLSRYSRCMWALVFRGYTERLRELLGNEPDLAKTSLRNGATLLWWLPYDESKALEMVDLLLAHGADPAIRNNEGETAADRATRLGMLQVAARLSPS